MCDFCHVCRFFYRFLYIYHLNGVTTPPLTAG